MISVAYMDPGNYSTAVAAGSAYQYKLLFSILLSNCLAVFLQILAAKLGAVSGLDLAANCRENLPPKLNLFIYVLAEIAIIATDLAEVVGTAIALNILFHIPLFAGVILTVVDVVVVLMAYRPNGPLLFIRIFEIFVSILVMATVVCFAVELYQVSRDPAFSALDVIEGFLPNKGIIDTEYNGLYLSLAILGATVMPHSLYLGSGLVQARLKDYDIKHGYFKPKDQKPLNPLDPQEENLFSNLDSNIVYFETTTSEQGSGAPEEQYYRPSIHAIKDTMTYTIVELIISLFTVALFVNATILIVAGATMNQHNRREVNSDDKSDADLFTIYRLLTAHLSQSAATVFALALLCSGQSAGVVCTLAGQMVLEGFLNWSFLPVVRRLLTRALAIVPCIFVVLFLGKESLAETLNALQVVLSVLLPVVTAPLIWFTCSKKIMRVPVHIREGGDIEVIDDIINENNTDILRTLFQEQERESQRFEATEPVIRLQTLRKARPCAGWEDGSEENIQHQRYESQLLWPETQTEVPRLSLEGDNSEINASDEETIHINGYCDMSNGLVTTFCAIAVWGFVTCLNIYLVATVFWN